MEKPEKSHDVLSSMFSDKVGTLGRLRLSILRKDDGRLDETWTERPWVQISKRGIPFLVVSGWKVQIPLMLERKLIRVRTRDGWLSFGSAKHVASDTFSMKVRLSKTARSAGPRERKNPVKHKNTSRRASRKKTA